MSWNLPVPSVAVTKWLLLCLRLLKSKVLGISSRRRKLHSINANVLILWESGFFPESLSVGGANGPATPFGCRRLLLSLQVSPSCMAQLVSAAEGILFPSHMGNQGSRETWMKVLLAHQPLRWVQVLCKASETELSSEPA